MERVDSSTRENAIDIRGQFRSQLRQLQQALDEFERHCDHFVTSATSIMRNLTHQHRTDLQTSYETLQVARGTLNEQSNMAMKLERELSLLDMRLLNGRQAQEAQLYSAPLARSSKASGTPRSKVPDLVLRYFDATGDVKNLEDDLHNLHVEQESERADRERQMDQDLDLEESRTDFDRRYAAKFARIVEELTIAKAKANDYQAACIAADFSIDPCFYSAKSDTGLSLQDEESEMDSEVSLKDFKDWQTNLATVDTEAGGLPSQDGEILPTYQTADEARAALLASMLPDRPDDMNVYLKSDGDLSANEHVIGAATIDQIRSRAAFQQLRHLVDMVHHAQIPGSECYGASVEITQKTLNLEDLHKIVSWMETLQGHADDDTPDGTSKGLEHMNQLLDYRSSIIGPSQTPSQPTPAAYRPQHSARSPSVSTHRLAADSGSQCRSNDPTRPTAEVNSQSRLIHQHVLRPMRVLDDEECRDVVREPSTASPTTMQTDQHAVLPMRSRSSNWGHEQDAVMSRSAAGKELGVTKALYETFKYPSKPKKFFRVGRVFMVLWTEPLGDERLSETSQFTLKGLYGDWLHQKVRRFIVIAEGEHHCVAIPILSYGNLGVAKKGLVKAEHGIVYMGSSAPQPADDELPGRKEEPMVATPIRVDPDGPTEKLGHKSRIQYSKVYTIEHNIRVRSVGMVNERSVPDLLYQSRTVWSRGVQSPQ